MAKKVGNVPVAKGDPAIGARRPLGEPIEKTEVVPLRLLPQLGT
jgi:hypothetical protein